ncbi:MAG: hypothetical protein WCJ24_01745 [Candidatus Saccharibacteria bacterium]
MNTETTLSTMYPNASPLPKDPGAEDRAQTLEATRAADAKRAEHGKFVKKAAMYLGGAVILASASLGLVKEVAPAVSTGIDTAVSAAGDAVSSLYPHESPSSTNFKPSQEQLDSAGLGGTDVAPTTSTTETQLSQVGYSINPHEPRE